jgi:predicted oxidoreductase
MINVVTINAITGEEVIVQLTQKEIADRESAAAVKQAEKDAELQAIAVAKAAVLDRLGITADEAALLLQ